MIRRLLQLEVQAFRSILKRQLIPLDADAVILYGPNGTGKSGILAAIEYGLTGAVSDLCRFTEDYPRCLTHVRSNVPGEVAVTFETGEGGRERVRAVGHDAEKGGQSHLSLAEQKSYVERCFLSQSRLHRLIDTYLSTDDAGEEQRLLRFGRELLGLDVLEDLATGLFEIADIRRIRNSSAAYQQLLNAKEAADEEVQRLERTAQLRAASFDSAVQSFQRLVGEPLSGVPSSVTDVSIRIEELETRRSATRAGALTRLQALNARLQNAIALIEASSVGQPVSLQEMPESLRQLGCEQDDLERRLRPVVDGLERDLIAEDLWIRDRSSAPDISSQIEELENVLRRRLSSVDSELKSLDGLERERRTIEARLAEVTSALALLSETTPASIQEQRQWVDVLRTIASRIHATTCPVCARDYSELGTGSLREKVLHEADQIAHTLQEAERSASSRAVLQADQRELDRRLATLVAQLERSANRRQELERIASRYGERLKAVTESGETRVRLRAVSTDVKKLQSTLRENQVRLDQQKQALADVQAIAQEAEIAEEAVSPTYVEGAGRIRDVLLHRIAALQAEEKESFQLRETAKLASSLNSDLAGLRAQLREQKTRQSRLESGCRNVELVIQRARALRSAAIETKSELLNQAFTGTLNRLWREFFERLARAERFRPEMSEPATVRNVIRSTVCAVAPDTERFRHIGSVLSSGNLNTAALSLFLALHVMDRTSHGLLVLDDPVQSADDVHVSQLAIMLRALMTQLGRQIVVAVHDRDLFEYLCLELTPIEQGRRLITIELQRIGAESDVQIVQKSKEWAPTIRFGT